jgi:putative transposase
MIVPQSIYTWRPVTSETVQMARKKTPSFVAEFPLRVSPADERALFVRLNAARQIYNACLGEALRRADLMRESRAWQAARELPKEVDAKPNKARSEAFSVLWKKFDLTQRGIEKFGEECRDSCWIGEHINSHDTQTTTLRAFRAVEQYVFGARGRPRFKRFGTLESIEAKGDAVIRYRSNPKPAVYYSGLVMPLLLDPKDKHGWQRDALSNPVKYVRILKREFKSKTRWYAQLVLEGTPPTKGRKIGDGEVGLDIGPSNIASFSLEKAELAQFCPTVEQPWKETRRVERALERSRRATNPDNFERNGTVKKGKEEMETFESLPETRPEPPRLGKTAQSRTQTFPRRTG